MKKLQIFAIATVLTFGIGGAVIASNTTNTPNVMNTAAQGQPENWVPLTDAEGCSHNTPRKCIGYQAFPGADVTDLEYGDKL